MTNELRTPKYMKIKTELQNKILSGIYKPGDMIPSDNELMHSLSVSKSTITQALKLLESEGFIVRQQGKGTFVSDQSAKGTVLTFYVCPMEDHEKLFWQTLTEDFNRQSKEFSVNLTFLSNETLPLRDILFQSFASGNAPDIFTLDGPDVAYWTYMNSLLPFDDYFEKEFFDSFLDPIMSQGSYRGKVYHLGYSESTLCILYDKKLFHKLGIRIPQTVADAWTWEEFLSICRQIKEQTDIPYPLLMDSGRGLTPRSGEWITYSGLPVVLQNNGRIFDENYTRVSGFINSPQTVQALQWYGDLFHKYHYTHTEPIEHAFPHHFAMSLSLPTAFFQQIRDHESAASIGIAPLPHGAKPASPHGSWGICMAKQTEHPEQCAAFIKYIFSLKNQLKISKYTGFPVLKEIYETLENFDTITNTSGILFSQLRETSFTRPQTPAYPFFSKHFAYAFYNICNGSDAQTELDHLAKLVDDHLYRHGYYQSDLSDMVN